MTQVLSYLVVFLICAGFSVSNCEDKQFSTCYFNTLFFIGCIRHTSNLKLKLFCLLGKIFFLPVYRVPKRCNSTHIQNVTKGDWFTNFTFLIRWNSSCLFILPNLIEVVVFRWKSLANLITLNWKFIFVNYIDSLFLLYTFC